jgi:fatty-acyl-CoA synthase
MPQDEWESLALNYTSGTTGRPKGVVYHHRGAYLMTMGTSVSWQMPLFPVYMAIVPLFHCNNWNHTWMLPMLGGTWVGCRDITAQAIYNGIADHGVGYFGGAPIVLNMIVNAKDTERRKFDHTVQVFTAGAPPAPATLAKIEQLGFNVKQVYGLTETYGHVTECLWDDDKWGIIRRRPCRDQGTPRRGDADDGSYHRHGHGYDPCPMDGTTQGEIMIRGNSVMKGYLKNPAATSDAFAGGYFHSGDIAVQHPDTYIQIQDRAKDIIISGGENISSVEVEGTLMAHPAVSCAPLWPSPMKNGAKCPVHSSN